MKKISLLIYFVLFQFCAYSATISDKSKTNTESSEEENEVLAVCKEAFTAVFGAGKYVMNAVNTDKRADGGRDIEANISLFGKGDVSMSGGYSKNKRVESFEIEFPESATIDFSLIDQLADGKISGSLPGGFPMEAGVWLKVLSIEFGPTGYAPTNLSATIGMPTKWNLIGPGSLSAEGIVLSLEISDPKLASRVITGGISGTAKAGNITMGIAYNISTDSEKTGITAKIEDVNLKNLLTAVVGDDASNYLDLIPAAFTDQSISMASFTIYPIAKTLDFKAESTIGNLLFEISRKSGAASTLLAISPPNDFKFSSLSELLAPMDELDMSGSYFIISDKGRTIKATKLNSEADKEVEYDIKSGLNLATSISLPENVSEILKINAVTLVGSIAIDFTEIDLFAALDLGFELADGDVSFDKIGAGLKLGVNDVEIRFEGAGSFRDGEERIEIFGGLMLSVVEQSISFEAGLRAKEQEGRAPINDNCLAVQPEWHEPFGIPGVGIRNLGVGAGLTVKPPWINNVALAGNLRLGTVKNTNNHICGSIAAELNISNVSKSMVVAQVNGLTPLRLIRAFDDEVEITGVLEDILGTGIDSAKIKIVPKATTLFDVEYSRGIALDSARMNIAGMSGLIGFSISETGIKAYGEMDPLIIEEGDFTFFAIKGAKGNPDGTISGPKVSLGLDAQDPHFLLDASVTVLEIEADAFVKIDKEGLEFEVNGNILDGALGVSALVHAKKFTDSTGFKAKVTFVNELQTKVADALIKFIEESTKENQKTLKEAKDALANKGNSNATEQAFKDLAGYAVDAVSEMDKGMAVAGSYVVKGLLKDAFNIRKMSFETEVTSMRGKVEVEIDMTIAGQDLKEKVSLTLDLTEDAFVSLITDVVGDEVIEFFGSLDNEIADEFEKLGEDLEEAFEDLGGYIVEGAEIVGEGIIEGANIVADELSPVGDAFIAAGEFLEKAFSDFGKELETMFVGSTYAPPVSSGGSIHVPYNHTLVRVDVKSFKVTKDEGDIFDDDLEIYGSIIVEPSYNFLTNKGATPFCFGKAMNSRVSVALNGTKAINNTKYFYIPNDDLSNGVGSIHIYSKLIEYNSNVEYDALKGSAVVNVSNIGTTPMTRTFYAGETRGKDEQVLISYSITLGQRMGPPPPPPSREQMKASIALGSIPEMNYLLGKGGNLRDEEFIGYAIQQKKSIAVVQHLMKAGNLVRQEHVDLSLTPQYRNFQMTQFLMQNGVRPNSQALMLDIAGGDANTIEILIQNHASPQLKHVQKALELNKTNIARVLVVRSNVQVGSQELNYAVDKNDLGLAKLFIERGGKADAAMITKAIEKHNIEMIDALLKVGTADHTSLQAASNKNDAKLFEILTTNDVRLVNNAPINTAIDKNNYQILKNGLENGGSKNEALAYSITKFNKSAMLVCLEKGANGTPALDYAIEKNDFVFYEQLVSAYGADVNLALSKSYVKDNFKMGELALNYGAGPNPHIKGASSAGQLNWVNAFLAKKANPMSGINEAVENQHVAVVEALLDAGANAKNPTLIRSAATNKNLPLVKLLVLKGQANADNGREVAVIHNDLPMTTFLLDNGAKPTGLHYPASKGWLPMVKLLVERGCDPNEGISQAIKENQTPVAIYLLNKGAKPGELIVYSAKNGNAEITNKLLEKGADPRKGNYNAVYFKHTHILKILIDNGSDVSSESLMDLAVKNFQEDMIRLLLQNKGNTTYLDKKGLTFLHRVAEEKGMTNLVKLFVEYKVPLEAKDKKGETALHKAVSMRFKGNVESVRLLIEAGADVNAKTNKDKTVLRMCKNKAYKTMIEEAGGIK